MFLHKNNQFLLNKLLIFTFLLGTACTSKQDADLIVIGKSIYTVDQDFSTQQAFAIKDGVFIAIGSSEDILNQYQSPKVVDQKEAFIYPGLYDAQCHFYGLGQKLQTAELVGTTSFEDVIAKVQAFAQANPQAVWIKGRGWDQNDWEQKEFPTKAKLDELFPDKPVFLTRVDGHAALVNQKALDLAKVTPQSQVSGGKVVVENGKLTGVLIDNAVDLFYPDVNPL